MDWGVIDSADSENAVEEDYYFHAHRRLLGSNKILLEYVKNIELLPPTGYTIYVNPLNIYDSCGAPVRMIAIKNPASSGKRTARAAASGLMSLVLAMLVALVWRF